MHRQATRSDSGFTLIELLVTLSLGAILAGLGGSSLHSWAGSNAHKGSRDEVVSGLRNSAQRALSEGVTYCMAFAADGSWKTYKKSCTSSGTLVGSGQGVNTNGSAVTPTFSYTGTSSTCSSTVAVSTSGCAYFYPRGTASAGTVVLSRSGKPTYTVNVEQLTSRVYTD